MPRVKAELEVSSSGGEMQSPKSFAVHAEAQLIPPPGVLAIPAHTAANVEYGWVQHPNSDPASAVTAAFVVRIPAEKVSGSFSPGKPQPDKPRNLIGVSYSTTDPNGNLQIVNSSAQIKASVDSAVDFLLRRNSITEEQADGIRASVASTPPDMARLESLRSDSKAIRHDRSLKPIVTATIDFASSKAKEVRARVSGILRK